jgi:SAM-dependent methyltransferase
MKINLGSGPDPLGGYINCDLYPSGVVAEGATSPNKDVDVVFDLNDGLPFGDNSASEIAIIQTLEHLENPKALLKDIYRVLKPNGIVDVAVPDLTIIAEEWMRATSEERWITIGGWPPLYAWIWGRGSGANRHLSGFDKWKLETMLVDVGFRDIEAIGPVQYLSVRLKGVK